MYRVGETVLYGRSGVCRIVARGTLDFCTSGQEYYVLRPITSESTVYVPVDSERLLGRMHRLLDRAALTALLSSREIKAGEWIENETQRKNASEQVVDSGDRAAILRLLRTLTARRDELIARGRHLWQSDERLLRDVERVLVDEISCVLEVSRAHAQAMLVGEPAVL